MKSGYVETKYPEKSWSISRIKTLDNCTREYYYHYYGAHNGWNARATDEAKLVWRLKKLTNLWMLFGEVFHKEVSGIIKVHKNKKNNFMSAERLSEIILSKLREVVKDSQKKYKTNEWNEYPNGKMLQEYYYGDGISKETGNLLKEKVDECVNNFYTSKTLDILLNTNTIVIENDEEKGLPNFLYKELKIYSILDLLYIDEDGFYNVVDWKTGKPNDEDKEQLLVYAWYIKEKYNIPFNRIRGRLEYLSIGEFEEIYFNDEDSSFIKEKVDETLKVMNFYLEDIEENKPKNKNEFYKTDKNYKCTNCNFRKICLNEKSD